MNISITKTYLNVFKIRLNFIDQHTGEIHLSQQQAAQNEVDKIIQIFKKGNRIK